MRRAVFFSFSTEFAVTVSMVACFKIAADLWGVDGFGEWALTRRVLSFLLPLVLLGLEVAVPRYVAIAERARGGADPAGFMTGALLLTIIALAVASGILLPFPEAIARVLFGSPVHAELVLPTWALIVSYAFYILAYSSFRGMLRIMEANLLHVLTFGVLPLLALLLFAASPRSALLGLAGMSAAIAVGFFILSLGEKGLAPRQAWPAARVLAAYGIHRMCAAFLLLALATLPPVIAANTADVAQAGFVVFGLTLVGMAGSAVAPLGVTLLPVASRLLVEGRAAELRRPIRRLEAVILVISLVGVFVVWFLAPLIARLFFGEGADEAALMLRIAAIGAGPYAYFMAVRTLIDAHTEEGVNTRNVFAAALAFVALVPAGLLATDLAPARIASLAYVGSLWLLALLTLNSVHRIFVAATARSGD